LIVKFVWMFGSGMRQRCDWTHERWDGVVVGCTLRHDHTLIVPWPHHAPTDTIIKPWKQTAYPKGKHGNDQRT
jgi:hypothetical protein